MHVCSPPPPVAYPFMGQYHWRPGMLGQAGQGQGPCWVLPLAGGASEQNRPSPARGPPRPLPKAALQALSPAVPTSRALCS